MQVPPLEPLERFPPLERAWLVRQMAEWLTSPPRVEESTSGGGVIPLGASPPQVEESTDLNEEENVPRAAAAIAASARSAAVDAHNGALQRVWRTHWLGLLGGYSAYVIDGGTDVDVGAWVQAATSDRRPFLRKLASSAPFHRWLEKVERGEELEELGQPPSSAAAAAAAAAADTTRTPTSPSVPTGTGIGALLAPVGAMAASPVGAEIGARSERRLGLGSERDLAEIGAPSPTAQPTSETAPSSRSISLSPGDGARDGARLMEQLAILELPDNLCEQPIRGSSEALHEALGTAPAHHVLDHWGIPVTPPPVTPPPVTPPPVTPPPVTLETPPDASTARVLGTALTKVWETLEWDVNERRDERDSSAVLLRACKAAVTAAPTLIPLRLMHARELLRASDPIEALSVLQAAQEQLDRQHSSRQRHRARSHKRRGKCDGPSIIDVRASSTTDLLKPLSSGGAGVIAGMERAHQDATLLALVSQCLARLDARQMAELATLRFTSPSTSPHMPTPSTHPAAPATQSAAISRNQSQSAEWRAKLRSTLSDVAAAAAAAGGGIHQRSGAMLPLGIHTGAPASHPSPAASSPKRQPLLAVWARAYLDGQAQREAQLHAEACKDCGTGDDDDDAGRNGDGGGESAPGAAPGAFLERWQSIGAQQRGAFSLGLRSLAEPTDASGAATGPPPGWGLGIPWAWGVGGGGRRSSQVDPVHFFRRLREDNGAEGGSGGGGGGGGSTASAAAETILRSDFDRFGGELLQVMGAPDLDLLWEALSQMQRRVAASEAEDRRMQALAAAKPAPSHRRVTSGGGGGLLDLSFDVVSSAVVSSLSGGNLGGNLGTFSSAVVSSLGLAASRDRSREPSSAWAEMVPSIGGGGNAPLDEGQSHALGTMGTLMRRADSGLMRRADSGLVRRADGGLVRRASYVAPKTEAEARKVGDSDEHEAEGDGGATTATGAALATPSTTTAGANAEAAEEKAATEKAAAESAAVDQAAVDQVAVDQAAVDQAAADKAAAEKAVAGKASEDPSGWSADGLWVGRGPSPPAPRPPPQPADELRLSIFEAWHSALRGTVHPSVAWRRRLGLEARELLIMRASRSSVRDQSLGMPGLLVLTSERLIFGSLVFGAGFGFRTAASLHALRAVQSAASTLGEALLRINIDGPGAEPVLLRFGRGAAARAQRDRWLASLELMRRAD